MRYTLYSGKSYSHYLNIDFEIDNVSTDFIFVQLPAWRPGRYELANFAKNIQKIHAENGEGTVLQMEKVIKDLWRIKTAGDKVTVHYNYYAFEMNAGSTYVDNKQLYVNPVNCFLYVPERMNESCEVEVKISLNWLIACGLPRTKNVLYAENYRQLVDSPFICSSDLIHAEFVAKDIKFNLWFNGIQEVEMVRVINDFSRFSKLQIELFEDMPCKEYSFLYQVVPYVHFHGVEHQQSTVISMGPGSEIMKEKYNKFLGVSSHELYHCWNIKAIRPTEMAPYDFTRENYSKLGYIAEGVTTYMGDLFLLKSGVFSFDDYAIAINKYLNAHFHNYGRFNYSVADSSFDTWLDGYTPGVPNRKTSIYVEGCMLAFIADIMIMENTCNEKNLQSAMKIMYQKFGNNKKGYSEKDYQNVLEEVAGCSFNKYFKELVWETSDFRPFLAHACAYLGLKLVEEPNSNSLVNKLGVVFGVEEYSKTVVAMAPEGPAQLSGVEIGDTVLKANGKSHDKVIVNNNQKVNLTVRRIGIKYNLIVTSNNDFYYNEIFMRRLDKITTAQKLAYSAWSMSK